MMLICTGRKKRFIVLEIDYSPLSKMYLPPLVTLRFFNIAAQTMSFAQAARQMNVTEAAVSRQIRSLEAALGVALFERRNRAVFLNEAGKELLDVTAPMFEQLESAVHRLRQMAPSDRLVVSCEPTIAMKWLIPRLPDFQQQHPTVRIQLLTAGGVIDFTKTGVDLAIRRNDFHAGESVFSSPICDEWVGPVCAPTIDWCASDRATPLLVARSRPTAWSRWFARHGRPVQPLVVEYEHFYLCVQAALAGQGVALASWWMVQAELASGQLIAPCGFSGDGSRYRLLSPAPLVESAKEMKFYRWLLEQIEACPLPNAIAN